MVDKKDGKRFSVYLTDQETRELELLRTELGMPSGGTKGDRDKDMFFVMKMATQALMKRSRDEKERKAHANGDYSTIMTTVSWEELFSTMGVPEEAMMARLHDRNKSRGGRSGGDFFDDHDESGPDDGGVDEIDF